MPNEATVRAWAVDNIQGFGPQYASARELGYEAMAADVIEISDEQVGSTDNGSTDAGAVARNRLRVDSRKWLLSKMLPKVYGDKQQVEHSGSVDVATTLLAARKRSGLSGA